MAKTTLSRSTGKVYRMQTPKPARGSKVPASVSKKSSKAGPALNDAQRKTGGKGGVKRDTVAPITEALRNLDNLVTLAWLEEFDQELLDAAAPDVRVTPAAKGKRKRNRSKAR